MNSETPELMLLEELSRLREYIDGFEELIEEAKLLSASKELEKAVLEDFVEKLGESLKAIEGAVLAFARVSANEQVVGRSKHYTVLINYLSVIALPFMAMLLDKIEARTTEDQLRQRLSRCKMELERLHQQASSHSKISSTSP